MKKIKSLFARNYDTDKLVRNEITEGSEWVANGDGIATRKFDGACCMVEGGKIYKRYELKKGQTPPQGFIPAHDPDPVTGSCPGWLLCSETDNADKYFLEAFGKQKFENGTYELCGPKINKNDEQLNDHVLIKHGSEILEDCPRTFNELKEYLSSRNIEGVVWYHPDGRMVKIKKKDFGLKR